MSSTPRKLAFFIAAALFALMSVGNVAAQPATDSEQVTLNVVCPVPVSVDLSGDLDFEEINAYGQATSTAPGAIDVKVDVGCYLGPWQVNASITNFTGTTGDWINAHHFSLENAVTDTYFLEPIDPLGFVEPTASNAVFSGPNDEEAILETDENWIWFFGWHQLPDSPAPFITTASYTGVLSDLGFTLPGHYQATMTVELTLE